MQKEELLTLLGPAALAAFDSAKRLALTHGGVLSPFHLLIGAVEAMSSPAAIRARSGLIGELHLILTRRFPAPSDELVVSKETQESLLEAGKIARAEGGRLATPQHLIRAALSTTTAAQVLIGRQEVKQELEERYIKQSIKVTNDAVQLRNLDASSECSPQSDAKTAPYKRSRLTGILAEFCTDLAEEACKSSAHRFVGREREVTAVLETLCRKLKGNPLLIGKPGVGKTAIVTAVADRLAGGSVPLRLQRKRILEVSRIRLLADAKYAGETEERLRQLLDEVRSSGDVVLFFDEIHTLLSAGGPSGTGDVANLLKSALSKGEIICIGATTLSEYYKYIARDEALARRFSTITVEEPSLPETRRILSESRVAFESYHGIEIDDEAISLIIDMADRYLYSRSFPDKGFDLMDKAAAKATLAGRGSLTREEIAHALSELTGLPLEIMDEDPVDRLEHLEDFLNSAVPGQVRAVRDVSRVIRIAKLRFEVRPERPDGVFTFIGPDGVGKREMAEALAKFLYGSSQKMIEFDMSQFTEPWSLSRLVGAEPGYAGYGERSGLLSKGLEDNPHSVLYFRNIDLAHNVTQQFLAEAFDQGRFSDSTGAVISLSNATVIMSLSRLGESNKSAQVGFFVRGEEEESKREGAWWTECGLIEPLAAAVDEVVEFRVLDSSATLKIINDRLDGLRQRLETTQTISVRMSPDLAQFFAERLAAERKGVPALDKLLQETIIVPFSHLRLGRRAANYSAETQSSPEHRVEVAISVEGGKVRVDIRPQIE